MTDTIDYSNAFIYVYITTNICFHGKISNRLIFLFDNKQIVVQTLFYFFFKLNRGLEVCDKSDITSCLTTVSHSIPGQMFVIQTQGNI